MVDDYVECIGYSDFEDHDDFCRFLKDNGIIDEFIKSFYNNYIDWKVRYWVGYISNDEYNLKKYLDNTEKINYFKNSFKWDNSIKGYVFWYNIALKWSENIKQ
jgi:hypothetical protein